MPSSFARQISLGDVIRTIDVNPVFAAADRSVAIAQSWVSTSTRYDRVTGRRRWTFVRVMSAAGTSSTIGRTNWRRIAIQVGPARRSTLPQPGLRSEEVYRRSFGSSDAPGPMRMAARLAADLCHLFLLPERARASFSKAPFSAVGRTTSVVWSLGVEREAGTD